MYPMGQLSFHRIRKEEIVQVGAELSTQGCPEPCRGHKPPLVLLLPLQAPSLQLYLALSLCSTSPRVALCGRRGAQEAFHCFHFVEMELIFKFYLRF